MRRHLLFLLALALVVSLATARRASAYPQFQFSSGTNKCSQCHYSPAGTGLISAWGRDESADTISMGGNGAFLHGAWTPPSWLALGGDLRLAGIYNDVGGPEAPEWAFFPMQADIYARAAYEAFSVNVMVGDRGIVRQEDNSFTGKINTVPDRFISREHYLMWRPSASGPYARIGRFFAPYGLRLVEHIFWVRRYTGYNLYEETYNLSGGYVADDWEVHATAFAPVPSGAPTFFQAIGPRESGAAVYAEKRLGGIAALAIQGRLGFASEADRYQLGAVGKLWVEQAKLLFMGEGDVIRQRLVGASNSQIQFVSFLNATWFPIRGLMFGASYERYQEDLDVSTTARNAVDGELNFFPWAHFEVVLLGRYQWSPDAAGISTPGAWLGMLQLHYYL
jgi:hypothetical protein